MDSNDFFVKTWIHNKLLLDAYLTVAARPKTTAKSKGL